MVQNEILTSRHFPLFRVKTGHFHFQNFQKSQPKDPNPVGIANIELIINPKKSKIFFKEKSSQKTCLVSLSSYIQIKKYNFNITDKINKYI